MLFAKHAIQAAHGRSVRVLNASSPVRKCRCNFRESADGEVTSTGSVDMEAIGKIAGATAAQAGVMCTTLVGLDKIMHLDAFPSSGIVPTAVVWLFCAFLSNRSRVFSFLDASRRIAKKAKGESDNRKYPSWTPPDYSYAIVWASITILRATSSVMVWQAAGHHLAVLPLFMYMIHLSIGDTWNHIYNVRAEQGLSSLVNTLFVYPSAWLLVYLYYQANPTAGLTLAPMGVALTFYLVINWTIWDMNGRESFLPMKKK
eukprot:TRINITY_DN27141_c0_g1_i1.p2 TRINITY_DN27141_c0_g1~~TRINITY_DN27141_c0_g1_i1.p2  ORF type:complete len:258 (-),score=13.44 TRINITY_DN27141_c0_g1_i1:269-1042(-)